MRIRMLAQSRGAWREPLRFGPLCERFGLSLYVAARHHPRRRRPLESEPNLWSEPERLTSWPEPICVPASQVADPRPPIDLPAPGRLALDTGSWPPSSLGHSIPLVVIGR